MSKIVEARLPVNLASKLAAAVLISVFSASCSGVVERTADEFPIESARYAPPPVESWAFPNGIQVFYMRDPEIPMVQGGLYIPRGTYWQPQGPRGALSAMASLMRDAGAGPYSSRELDRELEKLSASIDTGAGGEYISNAFSCLRSDVDRLFELLAHIVLRPRFESDRVALWKNASIESIRRRTDDNDTVADIAFAQLLYGDTVYGRPVVQADVNQISRLELLRLHRKFIQPGGAVLTITGDISREEVSALIQKYFGAWTASDSAPEENPKLNYQPSPGVYFIELPFAQASVRIGQLGAVRLAPDYLAIEVFNELFGSPFFGSRLMRRVRTELGLTYGISGGIAQALVPGPNNIAFRTKAESAGAGVIESIRTLAQTQQAPPAESELNQSKGTILNSYVFKFDTAKDVVGRQALLRMLRYPANYDSTYIPGIQKVTADQVREAAVRNWDLSKLVILVVGNRTAYNSIQSALQDPPEFLKGYKINKARFSEKLIN